MKSITSLYCYLLTYCEIQALLTIVSFPFLIAWGLPFSLMSFVGNFFGTPLITLFLGISTLLFITELLFIPNSYCIAALELCTSCIIYLLNLGSKQWLIALPQSALLLSIIGVLFMLLLYQNVHRFNQLTRIIMLLCICGGLVLSTHFFFKPAPPSLVDPTLQKMLYLTSSNEKDYILHDDGYFSRQSSPEKCALFDIRPYLIKNLGTLTLDTLELHRFNGRALKTAQALSTLCSISKLIIHKGTKDIPKRTWRAYYDLKRASNHVLSIKLVP